MRRREFITLLGSTAIWPRTARAQQAAIRRVAVVIPAFQDDQEWQLRLAAFVEVLSRSGWNDGRNVRLDVRWLGGEPARYEPVAVELTTGSPADVIVAISNPLAAQFKALTKTIPIVFISVSDPVSGGFVTNISRPGENITGFENFQPEMGGKWLGLLKEATNGLKRVGMLLQPTHPPTSRLSV